MSGYSLEQYAKMMGGDVNTMRNAFRPAAEQAAKAEAEKLLKKLEVQSDAETVKFGLFLQQLQQAVNGMSEQISTLREVGKAERAEKLNGVMTKILRMKLEESEGGKKE